MGKLKTWMDTLRQGRSRITMPETIQKGEAEVHVRCLLQGILSQRPDEVRRNSHELYLEAVMRTEGIEAVRDLLELSFSQALTDFDDPCRLETDLAEALAPIGGITRDQALYLDRFEDEAYAYCSLWPWGDPRFYTLKLGLLPPPSTNA